MRDSLVIYRSTVEAGNTLSEKQRLKFYESLFNYALDDVEPEGLNGTMKIFFELTKPLIDSNNRKYKNGCKGGRPQNSSDNSPVMKIDYAEDVILTENQFAKLSEKYDKLLLKYAIKQVQEWLEDGKSGNPNYKKAREALGHNHYSYFKIDGWAITKAKKIIKEENKSTQPNWSI